MSATLSGAQEVPPTPSTGSGKGEVTLTGSTLTWTVSYSGLTGPVTGAHFHGPALPGTNAGVVLPFAQPLTSPIKGTATLTPALSTLLGAAAGALLVRFYPEAQVLFSSKAVTPELLPKPLGAAQEEL